MKTIHDPVHFSNLKLMALSPAHCRDSIGRDDDKLPFRHGRLTHSLVLGVQDGHKYVVFKGRRQGKVWDAFEEKHKAEGYDIFTESEHLLAKAMADAILANQDAKRLIAGEFEVPVEWKHGTGRSCATRGIDVLNRKRKYTLEIKTGQTAHPGRFQHQALRMGYHAQGSWYHDAAQSLGVECDDHYVVIVEKKRPHPVTVMRLTARALQQGRALTGAWMQHYLLCEQIDVWPGYVQTIVDLDIDEDVGLVFDDEEAA